MKAKSRVVVAWCVAACCQAAELVRYPYLQNVGSDRAIILWATAEEGSGAVQFSADRSFSRTIPATAQRFGRMATGLRADYYQYQVALTGLIAGTEYFYRVQVDGQDLTAADDLRFRTAGSGPFRFVVFGDSGTGSPEQLRLARLMIEERPAVALHTGDIAYPSGTFEQFQNYYFAYYRDLMKRTPFFPAPGNHDYETSLAAPYLALHSVPTEGVPDSERGRYYSWDWGNVHFVALDTNISLTNAVNGTSRMLEWLESDLQRASQFWRVAYFHHPAYPSINYENDPTSDVVRRRLVPILERHDVPLVFSGHEHNYQQSVPIRDGQSAEAGAGTVHIITGGGGAGLYPVSPHPLVAYAESAHHYVRADVQGGRMMLRAIRVDGQEIDAITLVPPPRLAEGSTVNAASFTTSLAPGELVSIFGRQLASEEKQATSFPIPTELSGTAVIVNGRPVPVLYVSNTQINAQMPFDVQGPAVLRVTTPNGSVETRVTISEAAPAIFSVTTALGRQPAILHADGTLISPTSPAETGEPIAVFLTGLGQVSGQIAAGQQAPASPLLPARIPVEVEFGGARVSPSFTGLTPGFAGLYQVNVQVPRGMASGSHALTIRANGAGSTVTVPVRSTLP